MGNSNKRYYWIKLKDNFFDEETIAYIEEQENGTEYCLFYLKLCLKSIKNDGKLIRIVGENLIPYDIKTLAKITNTDVDTVVVAMKLFEQIGLITYLETGEIYLNQIQEMIGSETNKAELMRINRAKKKLEDNTNGNIVTANSNIVTQTLPECSKNVTQRLEIRDKRLDIRDIDDDIGIIISEKFNSICTKLEPVNSVTKSELKKIKEIYSKYFIDSIIDVFQKAENTEYLYNKQKGVWRASFSWLIKMENFEKVLSGIYDKYIDTDIKSKSVNSFTNFKQRNYDFEEIERIQRMQRDKW